MNILNAYNSQDLVALRGHEVSNELVNERPIFPGQPNFKVSKLTYIMIMDLYDGDYQKKWKQILPTFTYNTWVTEVWTFAKRVLRGLSLMHSLNIVHKDLKMDNIFVKHNGQTGVYSIGDFGLSEVLAPGAYATMLAGTPIYLAPEVLNYSGYTTKADIWSLGVILYEMITLTVPYNGVNDMNEIKRLQHYPTTFNFSHPNFTYIFDKYSALNFKKMIQEDMLVDQHRRKTVSELYNKYFLAFDPKTRLLNESDDEDEFRNIKKPVKDNQFLDYDQLDEEKIPQDEIDAYLDAVEEQVENGLRDTVQLKNSKTSQ